ncbi:hypothetical protein I3843_08G091600 [Carya illinoinensis]|nr:hypothetical protein I3843_08G091600 [Carya illinoinensis]
MLKPEEQLYITCNRVFHFPISLDIGMVRAVHRPDPTRKKSLNRKPTTSFSLRISLSLSTPPHPSVHKSLSLHRWNHLGKHRSISSYSSTSSYSGTGTLLKSKPSDPQLPRLHLWNHLGRAPKHSILGFWGFYFSFALVTARGLVFSFPFCGREFFSSFFSLVLFLVSFSSAQLLLRFYFLGFYFLVSSDRSFFFVSTGLFISFNIFHFLLSLRLQFHQLEVSDTRKTSDPKSQSSES